MRITTFFPALGKEMKTWFEAFLSYLPGVTGTKLRKAYFSKLLRAGRTITIGAGTRFVATDGISLEAEVSFGLDNYLNASGGTIVIGSRTSFNHGVQLNAAVGGKIIIGSNCLVGPNVIFRTASHRYRDKRVLIRDQGHDIGDIVLGNDVWIGAGAILLGGISIGNGAVIGAGSVVTRNIPEFSVAVGVPARVIKERF